MIITFYGFTTVVPLVAVIDNTSILLINSNSNSDSDSNINSNSN